MIANKRRQKGAGTPKSGRTDSQAFPVTMKLPRPELSSDAASSTLEAVVKGDKPASTPEAALLMCSKGDKGGCSDETMDPSGVAIEIGGGPEAT